MENFSFFRISIAKAEQVGENRQEENPIKKIFIGEKN